MAKSTPKKNSSKKSATKSTTKKKTVSSKTTPKVVENSAKNEEMITVSNSDSISINKKVFIVGLGVLVALGLAGGYFYQQKQIVATVNGQPISRATYISMLESQGGEQVLDRLITETLIRDAASTEGITVTTEEIDQEINSAKAELESQGQDFDQILSLQGITEAELRDQIQLQMLVSKLAGTSDEATVEEVDAYLEENAEYLPEDLEGTELRSWAEQQLVAEGSQTKIQEYLSNLRAQADIQYN